MKKFDSECDYEIKKLENNDNIAYKQYKHINPFDYIAKMGDPDCNKDVCWLVPRIDLEKINTMIWEIPEEIGDFCYLLYTAVILF